MSNLGLERYLSGLGLGLMRTQVGDRYVVERMRADGYNVGGEQSGHIILADYNTTGDGLIAGARGPGLRGPRRQAGVRGRAHVHAAAPASAQRALRNGVAPLEETAVQKAVKAGETRLGGAGRLLIRKSGTEPVIRVMAEGEDEALIGTVVADIVGAIEHACGHGPGK